MACSTCNATDYNNWTAQINVLTGEINTLNQEIAQRENAVEEKEGQRAEYQQLKDDCDNAGGPP